MAASMVKSFLVYHLFWWMFLVIAVSSKPPNIIILLADDLGYGDLPSYGHPISEAPVLEQLVAAGLRFTDFYSANPVCSPSRASLLTGRQPPRTGVWPGVFYPQSSGGLPLKEITIAETLKAKNYSTALIGKWHLGVGENNKYMPTNQGFDSYYGIPYTHDMCPCLKCFYPDQPCFYTCNTDVVACPLFKDTVVIEQPTDFTKLSNKYSEEARTWIRKQAQTNQPFFLLYAFHQTHNPMFSNKKFTNATERGPFGNMLLEMDWMVGEMLEELRAHDLEEDTFIFFTSDNGPCLLRPYDGVGNAGLLKCGKGTTYEGGQRVPAIAYWPGHIKPGVTREIASTLDLLPTIANIAQVPLPSVVLDGLDMGNILFNHGRGLRDTLLYYATFPEPDIGVYAVRHKQYKAHYLTSGNSNSGDENHDPDCRPSAGQKPHAPPLLYDLYQDASEQFVVDRKKHLDVYALMYKIKVQNEALMSWAESEINKPSNSSLEPCCNPGCHPRPECCVCKSKFTPAIMKV
ncbi:arylsulfatase A-like [Amphiura filiformis]|uniref:arylsulfatase A-like n=1 Tax=Amphiura filiformis TaxID=82378 RepID=UPI003B219C4E